MARDTMTVRIQPQTRKALDGIAASLDRDRTYIVNQALEAYIDVHKWQIDHIRQGLREANDGAFATEAEVNRTIARLRKK
jgi:RHH-type transcriptional regulator, rel operon repressor / antitoxin RelB